MAEDVRRGIPRVVSWLVYQLTWLVCMIVFSTYIRLRVSGVSCFPRSGGVMVLSNHQSYLDPPMLGVSMPRELRYTARKSLFRGLLGPLITTLGAIPLDRDGFSIGGIRAVLSAIGQRDALVYFPEGTRTTDGEIAPFKRGAGLVVRRSKVPIVICGIAGAYECWPRNSPIPLPGTIWIHFQSWKREEAASLNEEDLLPSLESAIRAAHAQATRSRDRYLAGMTGDRPAR